MFSPTVSMRISSALFVLAFVVFRTLPAGASVWKATGIWDEAAESRYSAWIQSSFDESFFLQGDWAGIETDCADAVYGSRIIFSYLESLPFSLSATDPKLQNSSSDFDTIADPVARVRAFMAYINNRTWTGTLAKHTYPVSISRKAIVPGVIWLKPGHVETIRAVRDSGVIELRGSWLPAAIRKMITVTILGNVPRKPVHGFRRWIWPQNFSKPLTEQLGYDDRQHSMFDLPNGKLTALENFYDVSNFESAVQKALSLKPESLDDRAERLGSDFCALLKSRSQVVRAGYDYSVQAGRCMTEKEYFAFSTPSRDSNLRRVVIGLGLEFGNNLNRVRTLLSGCEPISIGDNEIVEPYDFFRHLLTLDYSSNPHEKPAVRFGLAQPERLCPTGDDDEF